MLLATPDLAAGAILLAILVVVALFGILVLVGRLAFGVLRLIVGLVARVLGVTQPRPRCDKITAGTYLNGPSHGHDNAERMCPNMACGRHNPPEAVYCGRCGHRL
jgi:hypothetical protein